MSEQNGNPTLDELLRGGSFDLGDNTSDYDPFAQADELSPEEEPNITPFPTDEVEEVDNDEQDADEGSDDEESENQPETSTSVLPMKAPVQPSNVTAPDFNPLARPSAYAFDGIGFPFTFAFFEVLIYLIIDLYGHSLSVNFYGNLHNCPSIQIFRV